MGLIELGPVGVIAALGLAVGWTAAVSGFVLGLAAVHETAGRIIARLSR